MLEEFGTNLPKVECSGCHRILLRTKAIKRHTKLYHIDFFGKFTGFYCENCFFKAVNDKDGWIAGMERECMNHPVRPKR